VVLEPLDEPEELLVACCKLELDEPWYVLEPLPLLLPCVFFKLLPEEEAIQAHRVKCKRLHSPIWEADRHRTSRPVRSKSRRPDFPA